MIVLANCKYKQQNININKHKSAFACSRK